MSLRSILKLLAISAFLSASLAGYVYFYALRSYVLKEGERQAFLQVQTVSRYLAIFLSQNTQPAVTLAGLPRIRSALIHDDKKSLQVTNKMLDHFNATLGTDVCYLMDERGVTIASSNREENDSFVGENFSFRPYFTQAIVGIPYSYLALGTTSNKRGLYTSHPVYSDDKKSIIGVVVIKASIDFVESKLGLAGAGIIMVTDPRGVIFITNKKEWLYQYVWPLTQDEVLEISEDRQFGSGPWRWVGLTKTGQQKVKDQDGRQFILHQMDIETYPGWKVIELQSLSTTETVLSNPLIRKSAFIILILYFSIGLAIFFLHRKANNQISEREAAQKALKQSEERYRLLYQNTPAMLHSIGTDGRIISVSDYWKEVLGYEGHEVIGRPITDFFTAKSRQHAETVVLPYFFKTGICKEIPYQFVKRNGEVVDVLLSATGERNAKGETYRSLAVSIDVTERKKAEEALRNAQQELKRYTWNLERQVRKRTREISSLLKYMPAVVYMKDAQGRYMLVNTRFEKLFGVRMSTARNKTDHEILAKDVADQFSKNDNQVLEKKHSFQVEELLYHRNSPHTYLSVKFPIYNGKGRISGVGGIATDITELKNVQDQLVRLSASVMDSQEKERAYLARELHDELGQVLTVLNMDAVWLQNRLKETDIKAAQRAEGMHWLIDKTIAEVRNISHRLRPAVLDHLGLLDALEWYIEDYQQRTGITCVFNYDKVPIIDGAVATAAYRIVQEALTNVARHSGAAKVTVSIFVHDNVLNLSVKDSGRGFNSDSAKKFKGLGLAGMRERASLIRGHLTVISQLNKGTKVELTAPMANNNGVTPNIGDNLERT